MKQQILEDTPLLSLLSSSFSGASKNTLKKIVQAGRVAINDVLVDKLDTIIPRNSVVSILPRRSFSFDIPILYQDAHIVVVDKPEGLLSVGTEKRNDRNLLKYLKRSFNAVYPVQRLDRETSGVMVFALNERSKEGLKQQFMEHAIYREYFALLEGKLEGKGVWTHKLYEDNQYFVRVDPRGETAITHYEVLETKNVSAVKFVLKTGKKNQIRVQSQYMKHPIIGDKKYGSVKRASRLFLHAHKLGFIHPITQKSLLFTSPKPFTLDSVRNS